MKARFRGTVRGNTSLNLTPRRRSTCTITSRTVRQPLNFAGRPPCESNAKSHDEWEAVRCVSTTNTNRRNRHETKHSIRMISGGNERNTTQQQRQTSGSLACGSQQKCSRNLLRRPCPRVHKVVAFLARRWRHLPQGLAHSPHDPNH